MKAEERSKGPERWTLLRKMIGSVDRIPVGLHTYAGSRCTLSPSHAARDAINSMSASADLASDHKVNLINSDRVPRNLALAVQIMVLLSLQLMPAADRSVAT